MAHFQLENQMNDLLRTDLQNAPLMRWERKALEAGMRQLSISGGQSLKSKTPTRSTGRSPLTPHGKTPAKLDMLTASGGRKNNKSPSRKSPSRDPQNQSDRFIPNRSTTDFNAAHFKLVENENEDPYDVDPEYKKKMGDAINCSGNQPESKILSFKQRAPLASEGFYNQQKVLYSSSKSAASKSAKIRYVPKHPEKILDCPDLRNDYYLNLIHWSQNNHLAVALGDTVYLWNAVTGEIVQLTQFTEPEVYVSSVQWIKEGNVIAIGTSSGTVELWDVSQCKRMRIMGGHSSRIGCLSWNSYILSSGSRSANIHHSDVRAPNHHVSTLTGHSQEVCGLQWSPDGRYLASGGNDNLVNIWDNTISENSSPIHVFNQHMSAIKALAWCPWQPSLLASGGGTADRTVKFWNVTQGIQINSVDTGSQVCALLWSAHYKELASGHGFAHHQLSIWKYPTMTKVVDLMVRFIRLDERRFAPSVDDGHSQGYHLPCHRSRILGLALSPDGQTVASAAADETIRLWNCFEVDKATKSKLAKDKDSSKAGVTGIMKTAHLR